MQMNQEKKVELVNKLQEYNALCKNLQTLSMIESFLGQVDIKGQDAPDVATCLHWVSGMTKGMTARRDQIRSELPKNDLEINMGPEEQGDESNGKAPLPDQDPLETPSQAKGVAIGGIELQKGEPVLGGV